MANDHEEEKHSLFCEACGDCLDCYGEDPCTISADGKHVEPITDEQQDWEDYYAGAPDPLEQDMFVSDMQESHRGEPEF
jgi:hypothetical protein